MWTRTDTLATHHVFHDGKFDLAKQVSSALQITHRFVLGAQPSYAISSLLMGSKVGGVASRWRRQATAFGVRPDFGRVAP